MALVMVWDPIERFLMGMAITLLILCGIQNILRGKKRESSNEKIIMIGFALLLIGFAIDILFGYLRDFVIPGTYINFTFYSDYDEINTTYKTLSKMIYINSSIFFTFFLLTFEISVKRTKYLLTTMQIIITVIIIILPYELSRAVHHLIHYPFKVILIVIILFLFTKWSRLEFKAISSFLLLGLCLIQIAHSLRSRDVKILNVVPLFLNPLLIIMGSFISILPLILKSESFSKASILWKINGVVVIGMLLLFEIFFLYYYGFTHELSILILIYLVVIAYLFYYIIRIIKNEMIFESEEMYRKGSKEKPLDILGAFTKPQQITEEEVSISKEKKICLVCKGKVEGFTFICRECGTFYCEKCSRALIELENACWACNTSIDETKPSKPFKKEEKDEIVVEEDVLKKGGSGEK